MNPLFLIAAALTVLAALIAYARLISPVVVRPYEAGLLYRQGRFVRRLEPGLYRLRRGHSEVTLVDLRKRTSTVPGQEVLSADNVGLKISVALTWSVKDPEKAIHTVQSYQDALYTAVQLALRSAVAGTRVDELLAQRLELGKALTDRASPEAESLGLSLHAVDVKDVMFPGELKKIFAEVVRAQKEGQAALERARGETAALRSLANAARLLEGNPALMNLRILQSLSSPGGGPHTVVLGVPGGGVVPVGPQRAAPPGPNDE